MSHLEISNTSTTRLHRQQRRRAWCAAAVAAVVLCGATTAGATTPTHPTRASAPEIAPPYAKRGSLRTTVIYDEWRDDARQRTVPVRITRPADPHGTYPVVLFSHGLGGSRDAGSLWAEHWASHGYLVLHLQHPGSDESLWRDRAGNPLANLKQGMNARQLVARVEDVRFALSELARRTAAGEAALAGADPSRVCMAGHSFGAQTTQAVAGQRFLVPMAALRDLASAPIKAAIAFSPNARNSTGNLDQQFGNIRMPFLSLTGTNDIVPQLTDQPASARLLPYQHMPPGGKVLVNFEGADHMVFGGHNLRRPETGLDRAVREDVKALTLAFLDAYLRDDKRAQQWLSDGSAARSLTAKAMYSVK
jgi:predicted dienelactone hydrolase